MAAEVWIGEAILSLHWSSTGPPKCQFRHSARSKWGYPWRARERTWVQPWRPWVCIRDPKTSSRKFYRGSYCFEVLAFPWGVDSQSSWPGLWDHLVRLESKIRSLPRMLQGTDSAFRQDLVTRAEQISLRALRLALRIAWSHWHPSEQFMLVSWSWCIWMVQGTGKVC